MNNLNTIILKAKEAIRIVLVSSIEGNFSLEINKIESFLDTFAKDLLEEARREVRVEERKNYAWNTISQDDWDVGSYGYNQALSAVSAKWDSLLDSSISPSHTGHCTETPISPRGAQGLMGHEGSGRNGNEITNNL